MQQKDFIQKVSQRGKHGGDDKYYTKQYIADYVTGFIFNNFNITGRVIEPSAGNGIFYNSILKYTKNIKMYDIKPENELIEKMSFFDVKLYSDDVVISNPPFGFMSSLAIRFFNHAASFNVKYICFIVPKTFRKSFIQNKLNKYYKLINDLELPKNSFTLYGVDYDVPCCFQIWKCTNEKRIVEDITTSEFLEISNNADVCVRRVGGKAGQVLEGFNHNPSTTYFFKILKEHDKVVKSLKLMNINKYIDNTAGVKSISKNEIFTEINRIMKILSSKEKNDKN